MAVNNFHGVGKRKSSVARVWLKQGSGQLKVNGKDLSEYFPMNQHSSAVRKPLVLIDKVALLDVDANVCGGGITGQADAIKLGIARALVEMDASLRAVLKPAKLLSVDARKVERKKPGQKKARRKFQFVKR